MNSTLLHCLFEFRTLCGVFSFGEAVFLLLVGIVLAFLFWPLVASFALLNFLD